MPGSVPANCTIMQLSTDGLTDGPDIATSEVVVIPALVLMGEGDPADTPE